MAADIAPLPSPPPGARWRPVDLVEPGDVVLDVATGRRGRVTAKGRLDDFLAAAGRAPRGFDDVGLLVTLESGDTEPYAHAVHLVDMSQAEDFGRGASLPAVAFLGVVRLALTPA